MKSKYKRIIAIDADTKRRVGKCICSKRRRTYHGD